MKFNEFNLSAELLAEIEKAGFVEASPIQEQTIPLALEGKDVIGQAQTGTGKTAAFGLPTLEKIDVDNTVIQALVIAPTRELAVQSQEELFRFGRSKGVKVRSVYGGSSIEKQIKALKSGAHIVVGTPGRLLDLIKRKALKLNHMKCSTWAFWKISKLSLAVFQKHVKLFSFQQRCQKPSNALVFSL